MAVSLQVPVRESLKRMRTIEILASTIGETLPAEFPTAFADEKPRQLRLPQIAAAVLLSRA
jgi:hypothetical protein